MTRVIIIERCADCPSMYAQGRLVPSPGDGFALQVPLAQ